jgi:hypothetical protein
VRELAVEVPHGFGEGPAPSAAGLPPQSRWRVTRDARRARGAARRSDRERDRSTRRSMDLRPRHFLSSPHGMLASAAGPRVTKPASVRARGAGNDAAEEPQGASSHRTVARRDQARLDVGGAGVQQELGLVVGEGRWSPATDDDVEGRQRGAQLLDEVARPGRRAGRKVGDADDGTTALLDRRDDLGREPLLGQDLELDRSSARATGPAWSGPARRTGCWQTTPRRACAQSQATVCSPARAGASLDSLLAASWSRR